MAKNSITDYSKTAASNTDIQSVDIAEGCLPSGINNAIREIMADLADMNDGTVSLTSPSFAAASLTGNLSFGDNDKAIFGAGSDLEIYHDGSHSYIKDAGSGDLLLRGDNLRLQSASGENYLYALSNGATMLYNNNAQKLATTASGIDVTGTVTADGLTVQGDAYFDTNNAGRALHITRYGTVESESANFKIDDNGLTVESIQDEQYGWYLFKSTHNGVGTRNRLAISNDGDIEFFEDTGTTAKLFWDASAEALGIGTSSPSSALHVVDSGTNPSVRVFNSGNTTDITSYTAQAGLQFISYQSDSGSPYTKTSAIIANGDGTVPSELQFWTKTNGQSSPAERLRIDSSGNVGIGRTSSLAVLETMGNEYSARFFGTNTGNGLQIYHDETATIAKIKHTNSGGDLMLEAGTTSGLLFFNTAGSERMRIDSSGNLLVGQSSTTVPGLSNTTTGLSLTNNGYIFASKADDNVAWFNRNTSDGSIISLRKNGSAAGGISVIGTEIAIHSSSGTSGIRFNANGMLPTNGSGSITDNTYDLGQSGIRWNDLYLGGKATFGSVNRYIQNPTGTELRIGADNSSGVITAYTNGSERMRIDSSGNLLVGTASRLFNDKFNVTTINGTLEYSVFHNQNSSAGGELSIVFARNSSTVGSINTTLSATSYNTSSDYRLKENVTDVTDGITRVKQLEPKRFNFIADPDTTVDGFLAHEAQTIVPEAVHGEKDAVDEDGNPEYQGIDQAKLVPLLTAALQEAITKIEDLEARVATLEGN